jgi:hypothetical protein
MWLSASFPQRPIKNRAALDRMASEMPVNYYSTKIAYRDIAL